MSDPTSGTPQARPDDARVAPALAASSTPSKPPTSSTSSDSTDSAQQRVDDGERHFLLHLRRRRPRRSRFSGRTAPGGEALAEAFEKHAASATASQTPDSASATAAREHPESAAPETPHDADLRVDALEIGIRRGRLPRIVGKRLAAKLGPSATYLRRSATFLLTSPGRLSAVALILIVAILASGVSMWQSTSNRQKQLTHISQLSEPMANSSQNLYAALTIADASATTAFSRGTLSSNQDLDNQFDDVIAKASMSATRAATGISNVGDPAMQDIATVQRLLPVYTGMVETARANARQGNPVSIAYLASASNLMQAQILPAAKSLYESTSTTNSSQQRALSLPPWIPMSGIAAAILMLLLTQWWLTRRTGRLLNVGLLGSTVLMSIALLGVVIATTAPWQDSAVFGNTHSNVESLNEIRIDAQQLRADETLGLVRRQPADAQNFSQSIEDLLEKLNNTANLEHSDDIDAAIRAVYNWEAGHNLMMEHLNTGDYAGAVRVATDVNNSSSAATAFNELDDSLRSSIAQSRQAAREQIDDARSATAAIALITIMLTVLAAILVVVGFRHRLMEYL